MEVGIALKMACGHSQRCVDGLEVAVNLWRLLQGWDRIRALALHCGRVGRRSGRGKGKKRRGEKVESRFLPLWDWFVCLSLDYKCTPQDLGSWSLYFHSLIHTVDTYWACMGDRHWATEVKKLQLMALNNSKVTELQDGSPTWSLPWQK